MESTNKAKGGDISKGLYLGLLVDEEYKTILNYISQSLKDILDSYPNVEDCKSLQSNLENNLLEEDSIYANPWKFPKQDKHWHVTTLFKKGKTFLKSHPSFSNFEEGKEVTLKIKGMVYVPEKNHNFPYIY